MAFNRRTFNRLAYQLRDHADGYKALDVDAYEAATWANRGFTPDEAKPWIAQGFGPDKAARWADAFVSPVEARAREDGWLS